MNTKGLRWGCLGGAGLAVLLLAAAAAIGWLQTRAPRADGPPLSPVLVYLVSPSSGVEVQAGGVVPLVVRAVAPQPIVRVEFFVDGHPLGEVSESPESAFWSWRAWPAGIHTLSARATAADGQIGQSQTVIVNVLSGTGMMQLGAGEGQSLAEVGAPFGAGPEQMAAANPHVDPSQPLGDGQPVQVPVGEGGGLPPDAGESPPPQGGAGLPILITWQFQPSAPADLSYCYLSTGAGVWQRIPQGPFDFLGSGGVYEGFGLQAPSGGPITLAADCWAWMGGILQYLGQGQTTYSLQQPEQVVLIQTDGFVLSGQPDLPPGEPEQMLGIGGGGGAIPPPFALREPRDTADCAQHSTNLLAGLVCEALLNAPVKQFVVLQWEWAPRMNWPGAQDWINDIAGYHVFEIDPFTNAETFVRDVANPNQRVIAVPLPWGARCYGVRAYGADPAIESSAMDTYCPGDPPQPSTISVPASAWLTTGGMWIEDGDCDDYGTGDTYLLAHPAFGSQAGEVLVGSWILDNGCFRQGDYSGGLRFNVTALPVGAALHSARLTWSAAQTNFGADGLATNYTAQCVGGVGLGLQDWTGLGGAQHFVGSNILSGYKYQSPLMSLSEFSPSAADVTSAVRLWLQHPALNHGLILTPRPAPYPPHEDGGLGECEVFLRDVRLEIAFFAP